MTPGSGAPLPSEDAVRALREALKFSPHNIPLRQHLGETLLSLARPEEAEKEFRDALALAPQDAQLKLGLARSFQQQGKNSAAIVILEELTRQPNPPARAFMMHAHLLYREGEVQEAVREYHRAIELDPSVADAELAMRLGINASEEENEVTEGKVRASWEEEPAAPNFDIERPKITFGDIGGMDKVKEEIGLKIIHPLTHPEIYKAYGKAIGGGILMYGPPGCGKTHLARATAGEIKAGFISIGIHDVLDMWIGSSERNLHQLFDQARRTKPSVLFFDEVDALGASRSDMRQSAGRQLINQFLSEMDGVKASNDGVLILAATNAPWHLDSAFRRPGRFDRIIFVPPPDTKARAEILRLMVKGKPVDDVDFEQVAKKTDGFSGADLKAVVDVAIENKLREAMKSGVPKPLTTKDLNASAATVKPSTREWFATARNYALYSNQGGIYDDILEYMKLK
jgi:transitional endoplasmic reticulum ATPase